MVLKLKQVDPGTTTAAEVEAYLADSSVHPGSTPEPLWNDLLAYDPPLTNASVTSGPQVAVDNELLRAARADRHDRHLLLWVALNLADPRLDDVVREVLTDQDGHLKSPAVNTVRLELELDKRKVASGTELRHGRKATTNILSLLERCGLIVPEKHGGTIVASATHFRHNYMRFLGPSV